MLFWLKIIVIFSYPMCNHFLDIVITVLPRFDLLPFQVTVCGYNHKMRILLEKVIDRITNFKVEPDRFSVIMVRSIVPYSFLLSLIVQADTVIEEQIA